MDDSQTQTEWSLRIEPTAKWYLNTPRTVAPYLLLASGPRFTWASHSVSSGQETTLTTFGLGVVGAVGVDWFPVHWFSAGARTGIRVDVSHSHTEFAAQARTTNHLGVESFTSNILIHVYF